MIRIFDWIRAVEIRIVEADGLPVRERKEVRTREVMTNRILLYRMHPEIACELRDALIELRIVPSIEEAAGPEEIDWNAVDLVFCGAEALAAMLAATACERPRLRIVAASRLGDESEWVKVLECGACDYCAAPFETGQLDSLLQRQLNAASHIAA
jgi:DNA-binding NtrC family response regulator